MPKTDTTYRCHSTYLERAFGNIETIANDMLETVQNVEFDTMVGTGLSGTLVVPSLARMFGTYWAIVRKESTPHSNNTVEGEIGRKWLFVDDFISSGVTLHRVQKVISGLTTSIDDGYGTWPRTVPYPTEYVGTYQYEFNLFRSA